MGVIINESLLCLEILVLIIACVVLVSSAMLNFLFIDVFTQLFHNIRVFFSMYIMYVYICIIIRDNVAYEGFRVFIGLGCHNYALYLCLYVYIGKMVFTKI